MREIVGPLLCVALAGCYAYLPVPRLDVQAPGRELRLELTDSGSVVLGQRVGFGVDAVTGRLVSDSGGTYLLAVSGTHRRDGSENSWNGEQVSIARSLVSVVGERHFSSGRTILFGTLTTIALVGLTDAMRGWGGATVPGPSPGGPATGR